MEPIIIVSGFARSGTSMMMLMLKQGGINVLHNDNPVKGGIPRSARREAMAKLKGEPAEKESAPFGSRANEGNPNGYFEYGKVRTIGKDDKWMDAAVGSAMKVFAPNLRKLPSRYNYKIIVMKRDFKEAALSWFKQINKEGTNPDLRVKIYGDIMKRVEAMSKDEKNKNMQFHFVDYNQMVKGDKIKISNDIKSFLGPEINVDAEKMASMVNENLYRNRENKKQ